jgi:hypothetical protein
MTDIQESIAAIRAARQEKEALAATASQAEEQRLGALNAAKAQCFAVCGPIADALAETIDADERQALLDLEAETHAVHAEELAAAYATSAGPQESNPAPAGETFIEADVVVSSEEPEAESG